MLKTKREPEVGCRLQSRCSQARLEPAREALAILGAELSPQALG